MTRCAAASSQHPDLRVAVAEVIGDVLERVDPHPSIALLTLAADARQLPAVEAAVQALVAPEVLLAATVPALVDGFGPTAPAVGLWVGDVTVERSLAISPAALGATAGPDPATGHAIAPGTDLVPDAASAPATDRGVRAAGERSDRLTFVLADGTGWPGDDDRFGQVERAVRAIDAAVGGGETGPLVGGLVRGPRRTPSRLRLDGRDVGDGTAGSPGGGAIAIVVRGGPGRPVRAEAVARSVPPPTPPGEVGAADPFTDPFDELAAEPLPQTIHVGTGVGLIAVVSGRDLTAGPGLDLELVFDQFNGTGLAVVGTPLHRPGANRPRPAVTRNDDGTCAVAMVVG